MLWHSNSLVDTPALQIVLCEEHCQYCGAEVSIKSTASVFVTLLEGALQYGEHCSVEIRLCYTLARKSDWIHGIIGECTVIQLLIILGREIDSRASVCKNGKGVLVLSSAW